MLMLRASRTIVRIIGASQSHATLNMQIMPNMILNTRTYIDISLLILFAFFFIGLAASGARAQSCAGCTYYGDMYYPSMGIYPQYWSTSDQITYGINNAFATIQSVTSSLQYDRQVEANINSRRNALETQNSLNRLATEGIPPFASISPEGRPRSPKITWQDVESIRP